MIWLGSSHRTGDTLPIAAERDPDAAQGTRLVAGGTRPSLRDRALLPEQHRVQSAECIDPAKPVQVRPPKTMLERGSSWPNLMWTLGVVEADPVLDLPDRQFVGPTGLGHRRISLDDLLLKGFLAPGRPTLDLFIHQRAHRVPRSTIAPVFRPVLERSEHHLGSLLGLAAVNRGPS